MRGRPFKKGESGNMKGRPKGSRNRLTKELEEALREIEEGQGTTLFKHFAKRAFKNDRVLIAFVKKFIPDKAQARDIPEGGIDVLVRYAGEESKGNKNNNKEPR